MRRALAASLLIVVAMTTPSSSSSAQNAAGCKKRDGPNESVITQCSGSASASTQTGGESGGSGGAAGPSIDPTRLALLKVVSFTDGQLCTRYSPPTSPVDGSRPKNLEEAFANVDAFARTYPEVPPVWARFVEGKPPCAAPPSAEELAVGFVTTIPLPKPAPYIAPGYAITGLRAYLETRGSENEDFSQQTPLGLLQVRTTRTSYEVDWGDRSGRDRGHYPYPGLAWPEGRITHTYTDMGRYDVTVNQHWAASWTLAGQSGRIPGLRSAPARIDDFEVTQLQAVRNR